MEITLLRHHVYIYTDSPLENDSPHQKIETERVWIYNLPCFIFVKFLKINWGILENSLLSWKQNPP